MQEYLESILHMKVDLEGAGALYDQLPLLFKGMYDIFLADSGGAKWLVMRPKGNVGLSQLRKNRAFLEKKCQLNVALFLDKASWYSKDKMVEEGIPFVIEGDTVYLPFLGVLLGKKQREVKPVYRISFLTQRILLMGLYEGFDQMTVTSLAERLGVSKMAVSKCFDEIEYLDLRVLDHMGRRRSITMHGDKKTLWEEIRPFLRSPVIRVFDLERDEHFPLAAGISALAEYSMLADNPYPTYAIEKSEIGASGIREMKPALKGEDIGCRVLEVGYYLDCVKPGVQDPLSVVISIEDEMDDERVKLAVEEMLEGYVW